MLLVLLFLIIIITVFKCMRTPHVTIYIYIYIYIIISINTYIYLFIYIYIYNDYYFAVPALLLFYGDGLRRHDLIVLRAMYVHGVA